MYTKPAIQSQMSLEGSLKHKKKKKKGKKPPTRGSGDFL